jgi:hypothetical protein
MRNKENCAKQLYKREHVLKVAALVEALRQLNSKLCEVPKFEIEKNLQICAWRVELVERQIECV